MSSSLRFISHLRVGLAATLTGAGGAPQAQSAYSLTVAGAVLSGDYRLFGPGEVLAVEPGEVQRCFPPAESRDHEPNLFAHVELKSADLPWRFTPGAPVGDRLRPWLVLVVVDAAVASLQPRAGGLPVLKTPVSELPALADAWAWAHVQLTLDGATQTDLQQLYASEPHRFIARLICPRKLAPRGRYIACLVPAYDTGRDAALGEDVAGRTELKDAWSSAMAEVSLPVYHSWSFACGSRGDFEFLAEQLKPCVAPPDLGVLALDVSNPGLGLPALAAPVPMLGALCSPEALKKPAVPSAAERTLRDGLYAVVQAGALMPLAARAEDPVLAPPAYSATQAGWQPGAVWQQALNREPGWRAAAGLGAAYVRQHQEDLAASAWQQLEPVAQLQRSLQRDALKQAAGQRRRQRLAKLAAGAGGDYMVLARGACATAQVSGKTLLQSLREDTDVPPELASAAAARLAVRAGRGRRKRNQAAPTAADLTELCMDAARRPDFAPVPGVAGRCLASRMEPVDTSALKTVAAGKPVADAKKLALHPGKGRPQPAPPAPGWRGGSGLGRALWDATEPVRFLRAQRRQAVQGDLALGLGVDGPLPTRLAPALRFDTAFGSELARQSPEYILPGAGTLPRNSVATLAVNTAFIEAFHVGLNEAWGQEVLWREMPAAVRATSMRRFWDAEDPGDQIPAIRQWSKTAALGGSATALAGASGLALVVKGRLLERYPQAQVYAVPALWAAGQREPNMAAGPAQTLWPDITGELSPGVHYFIFLKLSLAKARGADLTGLNLAAPGNANAGWFFVLEEQAAAPRFGLDMAPAAGAVANPVRWDELNWGQVNTLPATGAGPRHLGLAPPRGVKVLEGVNWAAGAAEMAWITLQTPYRMYMHASSMLGTEPAAAGASKEIPR